MVLIQEVEGTDASSPYPVIGELFPLWGITLGKTTLKEAKASGYSIKIYDDRSSRYTRVHGVVFWDDNGTDIFTSIYWANKGTDFPPSWEAKGFSWMNSYDTWIETFQKLGFAIEIKEQPAIEVCRERNVLTANVIALSPDGVLEFGLDFDGGVHGCLTSSPQTLYAMDIVYKGSNSLITEQVSDEETFYPVPMLQGLGYENPDFVFWMKSTKKIYECYIEDDAYYVISELNIDKDEKRISRTRIGQIQLTGFMGYKLMRHSLTNLVMIKHQGGTSSEFHFKALANDKGTKDKGYDFYGNGLDSSVQKGDDGSETSLNMANERICKAEFHIDVSSTDLIIYRKTSRGVKRVARIPQNSDFGLALGGNNIARYLSWNRKKKLDFYIYRTDGESIYVKTKEKDIDLIFKFNMQGKKTKRILLSNFADVWTASFDGRHQLKNVQWEKLRKDKSRNQKTETTQELRSNRISLSVRQSTFEKIENGKKTSISRAMKDDTMARQFFIYNGTFKLNKKITAYIPSFTKVTEVECPFVPINYEYVVIRAEGVAGAITKKITSISVKKSYDVNDKYNWVITYTFDV